MQQFADKLRREITSGLPGPGVQWQMASSDRMTRNFPRAPGPDALAASVLIMLYPEKGSIYTLFMQRPDYNGVHGGQISFPGGKQELSDVNAIDTALREAYEETGANPDQLKILGTLTPLFIHVSNIIVTPVVAWAEKKPGFNHHRGEVVFLFDADIRRFYDPHIIKTKPMQIGEEEINVKYYDYEGNIIWGATAMMLNELLAIIGRGNLLFTE